MFLASNLKFLRTRRGRSQDIVAESKGINRNSYSGYEQGRVEPSIARVIALARYYNVSVHRLVTQDMSQLSEFQLTALDNGFDTIAWEKDLRSVRPSTTTNG